MNAPTSVKVPYLAEVVAVDGEAMLVLPPELLARLGVQLGDSIDLFDDGEGVSLRRHDTGPPDQMAVARDVMRRRQKALSELAK